jgi:hypothetical protein
VVITNTDEILKIIGNIFNPKFGSPKVPFLPLLTSILTWLLENNSPRSKASSY